MRRAIAAGICVGISALLAATASSCRRSSAVLYDLVIKNGVIVDGSGNPWFTGEVGVRAGKIESVDRVVEGSAYRTIDASGYVVSRGFVDMHCHCGVLLLVDEDRDAALRQGVTSKVAAETDSIAPIAPELRERRRAELEQAGTREVRGQEPARGRTDDGLARLA